MKIVPVPKMAGPSGIANVRLTKTSVSIVFDESGEQYMFPREGLDLPAGVASGKWFVSISGDGSKLMSIRPAKGKFVFEFVKFTAKEGTAPAPLPVKHGPPEAKYDEHYLKFTAILRIAEGEMAGAEYPLVLRYLNLKSNTGFGSQNGSLVIQGDTSKSKHLQRLADFVTAFGLDEIDIPYSANVLPAMQDAINRTKRKTIGDVQNGWINGIETYSQPVKRVKR